MSTPSNSKIDVQPLDLEAALEKFDELDVITFKLSVDPERRIRYGFREAEVLELFPEIINYINSRRMVDGVPQTVKVPYSIDYEQLYATFCRQRPGH